jgi:hypothetical protein
MLRWAAQAAKAAQGEYQPPLGIGAGIQDRSSILPREEIEPAGIRQHGAALYVAERTLRNQPLTSCGAEELFGPAAMPSGRVTCQLNSQAITDQSVVRIPYPELRFIAVSSGGRQPPP